MVIPVKDLVEATAPVADRVGKLLQSRAEDAMTAGAIAKALGSDLTPLQLIDLQDHCEVALLTLQMKGLVKRKNLRGEEFFYWAP